MHTAALIITGALLLGCGTYEVVRMPDGGRRIGRGWRVERAAVLQLASRELRCPIAELRRGPGGITSDWRAIHRISGCGQSAQFVCDTHEEPAPFEEMDRISELHYTCTRQ